MPYITFIAASMPTMMVLERRDDERRPPVVNRDLQILGRGRERVRDLTVRF